MLHEVLKHIEQRDKFLLTSHARPDGDAIGSLVAAGQMLRELGKRVDIVLSDGVPVIYHGLPTWETIQQKRSVQGGYEAALILECDSVKRTGVEGLDAEGRFLINIDHHSSAKPFGHVNWIDTRACATAEMIFELGKAAGVKITPEIATCLYTAVLTDTGSFCYQGTNAKTFALAQELVRAGADPARIAQRVYFTNPEGKMRLLGYALSSLRRHGKLAWMFITQAQMEQCGALEEDCEGLVNYALGIEGIETALFFRELPNGRFRVSLRSKGAVDVAKFAEQFGGGGHARAAGLKIDSTLDAAHDKVVAAMLEKL